MTVNSEITTRDETQDPSVLPTPISQNSILWKLKRKLQFSGWLQYLPSLIIGSILYLLAGLDWLIGIWPLVLFWLPLSMASLFLLVFLIEVLVIKFGFFNPKTAVHDLEHLDMINVMLARKSCRAFQRGYMSEQHCDSILQITSAVSKPEQLLGDKPIRFEYLKAPLTVWPTVGASEFLVALAPKSYDRLSVIDVGRSLQKVVIHATRLGLATCWIGPGTDHCSVEKYLGMRFDKEKDHIICVCAVGYRAPLVPIMIQVIMKKFLGRRLPASELFFSDPAFSYPLDMTQAVNRHYQPCFEACRWSPSSYNSQTTRMAVITENQTNIRFDFACNSESRYYAPVALGIWCANWEIGVQALGETGHFRILSNQERYINEPSLNNMPVYDISWIPDT